MKTTFRVRCKRCKDFAQKAKRCRKWNRPRGRNDKGCDAFKRTVDKATVRFPHRSVGNVQLLV